MSAAAHLTRPACERCGRNRVEVSHSAQHDQQLCQRCFETLDATVEKHREGTEGDTPETPTTETRDKEPPSLRSGPRSLVPSPSSLVSLETVAPPSFTSRDTGEVQGPEVEWLLAEYKAGRASPIPVDLPPLPRSRSPIVPAVAEFFKLVYGLRLSVDDDRPVPFACGWIAQKLGVPKLTVWRARKALADDGVLVSMGSLPGRGARGTEMFEPGSPR